MNATQSTTTTAIVRTVETTVTTTPTSVARSLAPLAVDVAIPVGTYYLMRDGVGASLITSLIVSSVVPAVRSIGSAVRSRQTNALALLMLFVNATGIVLSFVTGSARLLIAKDSGISSVVALGILFSLARGRPVMSAGLEPWVTKGDEARTAAWKKLSAGSSEFRRLERRFSLIWGVTLLAECVTRVVGAFTLPVSTMTGLSGALVIGAICVAMVVAGGAAADPMRKLVDAEVTS